jgi:hypothetical protein
MGVELDQDQPGPGGKAADDPAGVTAFARTEFDHRAGIRIIDVSRGPLGEKPGTWDNVTNPFGVCEDALQE